MQIISCPLTGRAQNLEAYRHVTTTEFKMDFYILMTEKKVKYQDELTYTWFKSQKIHMTQGNSSGNLLHGNFTKYHNNGQLAERGEYKYGLKVGKWTTWTPDGTLVSLLNYDNGQLKGNFITYTENGEIKERGKYKHGKTKLDKEFRPLKTKDDVDTLNPEDPAKEKWFKRTKKEKADKDSLNERDEEKKQWWKNLFIKKEKVEAGDKPGSKEKKTKEERQRDRNKEGKSKKRENKKDNQ